MGLLDFLNKKEPVVGIDIGTSVIKVCEIIDGQVTTLARGAVPRGAFQGYTLSKPEQIAEVLQKLWEANGIHNHLVSIALPAPSVFSKRIKVSKAQGEELTAVVRLEAGNVIPHKLDAVKLDYHVLGETGKNQLDVLVVAVKTEVFESYEAAISGAGLELAVVDVDSYALFNAYENAYPELKDDIVAILDCGFSYTNVLFAKAGDLIFMGDVSVAGADLLEQYNLAQTANVDRIEEAWRRGIWEGIDEAPLNAFLERAVPELSRQVNFFWNASGVGGGTISKVLITGGVSSIPALKAKVCEKLGLPCELFDPFRKLEVSKDVDTDLVLRIRDVGAVVVGLAHRQFGDKAK